MPATSHDIAPIVLAGATGAVGQRLLARLRLQQRPVIALSRRQQAVSAGVRWLDIDLYRSTDDACAQATLVYSAGPLDGLAAWTAHARWPEGTRIIALSSLSAETKHDSALPDEGALAQRLCAAEATLRARAAERGWCLTLLRVSLIYDPRYQHLSLDRLADLGRRLRVLPLPSDAQGLRQPVHADDLARAMLALAESSRAGGDTLRLPGGEALPFAQMVRRYMQSQIPAVRVLTLPALLARCAEALLQQGSPRHQQLAVQLRRSRSDLVVKAADWGVVGLQPRRFLQPENGVDSLY